jgi:iron(III) transport system ATP-binding protein
MTFLGIEGVHKRYGAVTALNGIDLNVPLGSRTAIVGPSGSGKTTLLRIIAGFESADAGYLTLDGEVLNEGKVAIPAHRRSIGFVPQDGALFPHLSIADNIGFGLARGMPGRDAEILALLQTVELDRNMLARRPHELSGGQQQRVALARALARKPKLMLLDEPFSALDAGLRETLRRAVVQVLEAAAITTIMVTHDQAEALSFADQVAVLRGGRLAQVGAPQQLYLKPNDRVTAAFLGDAIILPAELGDGWVTCAFGRIAAQTGTRRGPAEIMLRPEQIRLTPISPFLGSRELGPDACHGQVTAIDFGGAMCTVALSPLGGESATAQGPSAQPASAPWLIKTSSIDLPRLGSRVRITVLGHAHVLTDAPP